MPDPVSWKVIEKGWTVVSSDGHEVGSVHEVFGDSTIDIFNGLGVSPGLLKRSRYVASERVSQIVEGRIELDLDAGAFDSLPEAGDTPPSADIRADTTDLPDTDRPAAT